MTQIVENRYHPLPQPDEITQREREDAMGSYLMMFAAVAVALPLPVVNLIAAVIYYYVNRRKSRFIHFHTMQSLLSQLPTTLLNWVLLIWAVQIWYFHNFEVHKAFWGFAIMVSIANLLYFVFSLVAAYKARKGMMYYFVFFGKLSYVYVFAKSREFSYDGEPKAAGVNKPPNI